MNRTGGPGTIMKQAARDEGALYDTSLPARFYPEMAAGGFARDDGTVQFYSRVAALLQAHFQVLDFGAGRGEPLVDDPVEYRRRLMNIRGRVAHVAGCDVDPAVAEHPGLDSAALIGADGRLPYKDGHFDLIVSRYVFEHLPNPALSAAELTRVLKPGGWICAVTPNATGYVALGSRLVNNSLHARWLRRLQPGRREEDVFPTYYRLNSERALRQHFGAAFDIHCYRDPGGVTYHFGSPVVFALLLALHRVLPTFLQNAMYIFMRKHGTAMRAAPGMEIQ
jgi:SAM-dependent methyltransferase